MQSRHSESGDESGRARPRARVLLWLALGCLFLSVCMACLVTITAVGIVVISQSERSTPDLYASAGENATSLAPPLQTYTAPTVVLPTATSLPALSDPESTVEPATPTVASIPTPDSRIPTELRQGAAPDSAFQDLSALLAADYPARDYYETANRLGQSELGKRTLPAQVFQVGDRQNFNTDDGLREAVLTAVTDQAYYWVESTLDYDRESMDNAVLRFENQYYPAVTKLYGTAWRNGIDDDPRFSVLHLDGYADGSELGFFNSGDQYPRSVNESSNEQEIIYLNMENLRLGEPLYFGTLVHELQHLIQWQYDPNEPVWLSEGLAQFTELYVGLDTVDTSVDYLDAPGTRLNTWVHDDGDEVFAHYGAAYLFVVYFWEQYGDQAIQDLMLHPADGLAGFSAVLAKHDPSKTLDQFVIDWATANYLDSSIYGPGYSYEHLSLSSPHDSTRITQGPYEAKQDVEQFGVSYVDLDVTGQNTLTFAGGATAELLPAKARSGEAMWYVPALDELDAQLTASFDLTGLSEANLTFWTWFDLEEGYDFAYVSASGDGGLTWDLLTSTHAGAGEYGPAMTGQSARINRDNNGWLEETVSLAAYAGGPVLVRFEVLSDSAIAENGFAIDDIVIPELSYYDDVETDAGFWQARGFVRTGHQVPQIWRLNLILYGPSPQVVTLDLEDSSQGSWVLDFGDHGGALVITAQTPFVSEPATYWLAVDPLN